jgi:hypothetical protein
MKKLTQQQKEIIRHEDQDPLDGMKAVGCLFSGIVILIIILVLSGLFIHSLR